MALGTNELPGSTDDHKDKDIIPDSADATAELPETDVPETSHTRRNVLIGTGVLIVTGGLGAAVKAVIEAGQHGPNAAPVDIEAPSTAPTKVATSSTPEVSATPEIPEGAVSFDAAMTKFEGMTSTDTEKISNTNNYTEAAGIMAALFVNAAQNQEWVADSSPSCEVASPLFKKNPVSRNMMDSSVTAPELLAAAFGAPQVLSSVQSTERTTEEGSPLNIEKGTRVLEIAWGIGAKNNAMLKGKLDESVRRLKAPTSDGTMNVRAIGFGDVLKKATFVSSETTVSIDGKPLQARRVKFYSEVDKSYLVATIVGIPLEATIYDIPKQRREPFGFKESILPTDKDGKLVYSDGTRVNIPMVLTLELA